MYGINSKTAHVRSESGKLLFPTDSGDAAAGIESQQWQT